MLFQAWREDSLQFIDPRYLSSSEPPPPDQPMLLTLNDVPVVCAVVGTLLELLGGLEFPVSAHKQPLEQRSSSTDPGSKARAEN